MIVSLIIIGALVAVGVPLYLLHRRDMKKSLLTGEEVPEVVEPEQCCGLHITCEKDSLLASVSEKIEYYEDEELDRFRGRGGDEYTELEIEEFRDVLITLLPTDIAGWARSVQLRGIELPHEIREELLMIVSEARNRSNSN